MIRKPAKFSYFFFLFLLDFSKRENLLDLILKDEIV